MTITQLLYVLAVSEHKNFTKAAQNCHVTQPTLSICVERFAQGRGGEHRLHRAVDPAGYRGGGTDGGMPNQFGLRRYCRSPHHQHELQRCRCHQESG